MEGRSEAAQVELPSSKRLYNWNTTHFYPDVHKLDDDALSVWRQRRHSEPLCFLRFTDNVSTDRHSSGSTSSLASFDEVSDKPDTTMPVSQLTVQLSTPPAANGTIAKVDVDLDSSSESENDFPKTWHRSPLHIRRGRRSSSGGRSGKKTELSPVGAGELWTQAADRPSMRLKEQAEKRRKFLQQRCQVYGWDLTTDQQSVVDGHIEDQQQCAAGQSQENMYYIDHSPENDIEVNSADVSSVAVRDRIHQFETVENTHTVMDSNKCIEKSGRFAHVGGVDEPFLQSTATDIAVKESSFENIYDSVSLEPDKSSDDAEVVQLYEPRQARVDAVYCYTKPLTSTKLPHTDFRSSVRAEKYIPNDGCKNLSSPQNVAYSSVSVAPCNVSPSKPSSASVKSMRKSSLDAKSLVEEEKLKFVEYKIEYRRQHSSGNESGSGKSDGEKNTNRQPTNHQPDPSSKLDRAIPPDDYEYILRKIHYNRPQNKADQKPSAGQPYQGSELHIEIKKPQMTTHHVTVDVGKPSVPLRVESLQHSGLHCHLPAKPDVIPSPNYPSHPSMIAGDFCEAADINKDLNASLDGLSRTVVHDNRQPVLSKSSALPAADENHIYHWDSRIRRPDGEYFTCSKPQYTGFSTTTSSQNTEPNTKPPKPPQEELPRNRSPDFWHYNTTYEPGSLQQPLSQLVLSNVQEIWHTPKTEHREAAKISDKDLVNDLVRSLDENSELTREATAVFREQYRWSIREPCRTAKPDQLKQNQLSQLPCSEVFVSSVCVPSKPVNVDHTNQPSSNDGSRGHSHKETVFSVTGCHRPQQLNISADNDTSQRMCLKNDRVYPSFPDVHDSYSNFTASEPESLYRYSKVDKRKPIINSPEMETALNRDCQQRYFYCSGQQTHGQSSQRESSRNEGQCSGVDTGLAGWKHDSRCRDNYTERDVHKGVTLLGGQRSQDRLVQQMSLGSQEVTKQLHSNPNYCNTNLPVSSSQIVRVYPTRDHIHTEKSPSSRPGRQRPTEVIQPKDRQSMKASDHMPSRASHNYERHILYGQESYRSQVMTQIEPSSFAVICTTEDKSLNTKICQNTTGVCTSHSAVIGCSPGRMAESETDVLTHNSVISSDRTVHEKRDDKVSKAYLTKQGECELYTGEDSHPVNVAEIKAKLFGPNENGARKLLQRRTGEDCQRGVAGGETCRGHVTYPHSEQKKLSLASDELTEFEKLVETLDEGEMPLESHSDQCNVDSSSLNAAQYNSADDGAVKRLSLTNIKVLESSRGKQSPSLEYAKEWLISGRCASSVNSEKSSENMLQSFAADGNSRTSAIHNVPPAERLGSFVSRRKMESLGHSVGQSIAASNVSGGMMNVVTNSGMLRSTPAEGYVVIRSHPSGQLSSIPGRANSSFARRSLPALTEKDAERWRNMVSRIQEKESRKEAKSCSVERLAQLCSDPEMCNGSAVSMKPPARMVDSAFTNAQRKLAVSAQPLQHSMPDIMMPCDAVSMKPKRQQTPRDVKCRSESRMKGICANTDSGYLDSESDSHGSSVTDTSRRLPSESNESDELELQRHVDEDDDIKLASGSLSFTSVISASTVVDKHDMHEFSLSEHREITESPECRNKQLQKLRKEWYTKNALQSHSSYLTDAPDSSDAWKSNTLKKDVAVEHTNSPKFERSVPFSHGLPKGKPAKPLYVSPLISTSGCGMYRTPPSAVSGGSDDHRCVTTLASTQMPLPSKVSTFKVTLPSQGPRQSTGNGDQSTVTPQFSKVTHIPVQTAGLYTSQSLTCSSAFTPYVERKDVQVYRQSSGGASVTEIKRELIQVEPEQYEASKLLERTVDHQSAKSYQLDSEQFKHQRQELKEPHVKITRHVTDSKTERTYRIESRPQPKLPQLIVRNELDKCELSDGEMTDATDITLDVMVGANQLLTPTVDTVDFSDVEFLSSANLPPKKCDSGFAADSATLCVSDPSDKNLAVADRIRSDDGSGDAAVTAAKAEMQQYSKNNKDVQRGEPPVERRRSIKELVHSFEGLTSPFMRVRPRSMEIQLGSSSE